ncbi:uncharacterized protein F5147DRAFT_656529 [Suillus discolor]|uniref:Uncharacterized protein n=1 Tax=Suillus discolor TaxID=1912936 RepID=A0A9P7EZ79_9AGAM|nr:uncharacterized protein F5147DRAFT_656529 [Suillus discolor]KAG2096723.1 hypothetical protein F5147DRAFT_656529 [Suillus discolor]
MLSSSLKFDITTLQSLSALASSSDNPAHHSYTKRDNDSNVEIPASGGMCDLYGVLEAVNSLSSAHEPTDSEASLVLDLVRAKQDVFRAQKTLADCVLWKNKVSARLLKFQAAAVEKKIDETDIGLGCMRIIFKDCGWSHVTSSHPPQGQSQSSAQGSFPATASSVEGGILGMRYYPKSHEQFKPSTTLFPSHSQQRLEDNTCKHGQPHTCLGLSLLLCAALQDINDGFLTTILFVGTIFGIVLIVKHLSAAVQNTRQFGIIKVLDATNFPPSGRDDSQHHFKSKSSSNLLSADNGSHSAKIFGIQQTHSGIQMNVPLYDPLTAMCYYPKLVQLSNTKNT